MSWFLASEDGALLVTEAENPIIAVQALRESVLESVAAHLALAIPEVPVERARRAPVDIRQFPRLIVVGTTMVPDETQSPGETFWTIGFTIMGFARGDDDLDCEQTLTMLHARVVAELQAAELGSASVMPTTGHVEFATYTADNSSAVAGDFAVNFDALAVAPTGSPYAPV